MHNQYPLSKALLATDDDNILHHPMFASPSVFELIKDLIRPKPRAFDCLQVEVTSHCTAQCAYCPHTTMAKHWQGTHMLPQTLANLWPLFKQSTRVHLQGWGEPFLHPHFFDYVHFARKADCLVSTTSCGLHLTENMYHTILNSGIDIIAFSLAGTDTTTNAIRKGANFDKVYENILNLQSLRKKHMAVHLEIHIAYILLADRMEAVLTLPKIMHQLGITTAIISTLDYVPHSTLAHLAITPNDVEKLQKAKEILTKAKTLALEYGVQLHYALPSNTASTQCRENIQKNLYINAKGDISPCVYLNIPLKEHSITKDLSYDQNIKQYFTVDCNTQAIYGNVNNEYVMDIWQKDAFVTFRQQHAQKKPAHPQCQSCVKRYEILE